MRHPTSFLLFACVLAVACTPTPTNTPPTGDVGQLADAPVQPDAGGDAAAPVDGSTPRIACTDDAPCAASGQRCYRPLGYCVQCASDSECTAGAQVCTQGRCVDRVACTTSRQCPGQVCDLARGLCADCSTDPDCPSGSVCRFNNCVAPPMACRSSRECGPLDQVCDAARGVCVDCLADPDCPAGNYCANSTCVRQACTPNAVECVDATRTRGCDARGTRWSEVACPASNTCVDGRCTTRLCAPESRSCADATTRRVCNTDGLGYTSTACAATESCDRGDCLPRSCTPGATVCSDGLTRRVCNPDGLGFSVSPCPAGQGCVEGACAAFMCTPGSATCADATTRRLCAADGQSYANSPCAAMQTCSSGACRAWTCTPGASTCVGNSRSTCNADGITSTTVACSAMESCNAGRCVARVCSPGTLYCDAMGNRQLCSADGTTSTAAPCDAGQVCSSGTCRVRGDACPGIELVPDGPMATVIPTGLSTTADLGTSCGSGSSRSGWTDVLFRLSLTSARDVTLVVNTGLSYTRVQLQATCAAGQAPIGACLSGGNLTRRYRNLSAGDHFVVVEIYGTTGPIQISATTTAPNMRAPGDTCPGVTVPTDGTTTNIVTTTFDNVSDVGTSCGSAATGVSRDGYTDWVAHFTLSTTRDVTITAAPSGYSSSGRYELRSGCGATGTPIGSCSTGSSINRRFRALPPGDYYLIGEQPSTSPGTVPVTVTTSSPDARAVGDACSTAALVVPDGSAVSITPSGLDYTSDVGTPCGSMSPRTDRWYDVMWRFTLTAPRDVQLNFTNLPSYARWQVYQGCGGAPQGACNSTNTATSFVRGLAAGDYFVVLETQYSISYSPSLRLVTVAPGSRLTGDACVNPTEVTVDGASSSTSLSGFDVATDVGAACTTTGPHTGYADGVWHFRLTATRDVTVSFSGAPSTFYWQLQRTCSSTAGVLGGCQASSYSGSRRFRDLPPGDYYVIGEWYGGSVNTIALSATSTAPTPRSVGDVCANAVPVTPDGSAASVAVDGLALGGDYSTRCGSGVNATTSYRDAVFSYTLTSTRDVTVTVAYAGTAYFEVWSTCGDSASALLTCTTTSGGSGRLTIPRQAPGTYFIVAQTAASTGPLAASVSTMVPGTMSGYSLGLAPSDVNYTDVCSAPGAARVLPSVDDSSVMAALPFAFRFWGSNLAAGAGVGISSNGFINLTGAASSLTAGSIPDASDGVHGVIAANWIDLVTGPSGVCYATLGVAPTRRWVVQWSGARRYSSSSSPINMEIVLNESTNTIDLVYGSSMTSGGTIGVENQTGTQAVTYPSTMPLANVRLRFTPN
ncbi:MAG: hypothetical protein IPN17_14840 [Deltaproteobacteria bacterium]|nr:hypothetical protein [Deltaproteobacteria bacterium]